MTELTGGCLCSNVRYRCDAEPLLTAICHCRHCQRSSGSAFSVVTAVPANAFEQTGETRVFLDTGETGRSVERHFCANCGSPILSLIEPLPDLVLIKAGTLDAPENLAPSIEVFCESRIGFIEAVPGAEQHARSNV